MIIFYNKFTGAIEGTIDGRVHDEQQLKMWVGEQSETERIVIQWKAKRWLDPEGNEVDENAVDATSIVYEPDHPQAALIAEFERRTTSIYSYKIDLQTKELVQK